MIVAIDEEKCIGCGVCTAMVPALFEMKEDKAIVIGDTVSSELEASAQQAKESCPVDAISIS